MDTPHQDDSADFANILADIVTLEMQLTIIDQGFTNKTRAAFREAEKERIKEREEITNKIIALKVELERRRNSND